MAVYDNAYSRFVAFAKIALPLAALGLLSTFFLFSRGIEPENTVPFARVDVDELARESGIGAARFAGVTDDGTAIALSAERARPDPDQADRASAEGIAAELEFSDGSAAEISAGTADIDIRAGQVLLGTGVRIETSDGYLIQTERLLTGLNHTYIHSDTQVSATGPLGELTAGRMELSQVPGSVSRHVLVFKDGVKLVYTPLGREEQK